MIRNVESVYQAYNKSASGFSINKNNGAEEGDGIVAYKCNGSMAYINSIERKHKCASPKQSNDARNISTYSARRHAAWHQRKAINGAA